ncbi:MAG: hypothetical protein OQL19_00435 [Gammaproteobacteria bacterium]|nr:hypothetical protein [Gammaproteobacteria bacterium]
MIFKQSILIFLGLYLSLAQAAIAANWSFPGPPDARVEWVTSDAQVNNINVKGRIFHSKQSMERVLQFYRNLWEGNYAEIEYGPWILITAKTEKLVYTVQVQPKSGGKGSYGILGVTDISEKLEAGAVFNELAKDFPKMQDSDVTSEMKMDDPGKKGKVILLSNKYSLSSNVVYYKNYYQSRDWNTQIDYSTGFNAPHTLVFTKGRESVNLVIARADGATNIVANVVDKGVLSW